MGALITCCRKPKSPTSSSANVRVVNEEVNIRNGEVVVENRTDGSRGSKYAYKGDQIDEKVELKDTDGGEVVEETVEIKANRGVHAAPPVAADRQVESKRNPSKVETETTTVVAGRGPNTEFQRTTIVRESVETRTVSSQQRSSIPTLKTNQEGNKPKPKVVIVREYQ